MYVYASTTSNPPRYTETTTARQNRDSHPPRQCVSLIDRARVGWHRCGGRKSPNEADTTGVELGRSPPHRRIIGSALDRLAFALPQAQREGSEVSL